MRQTRGSSLLSSPTHQRCSRKDIIHLTSISNRMYGLRHVPTNTWVPGQPPALMPVGGREKRTPARSVQWKKPDNTVEESDRTAVPMYHAMQHYGRDWSTKSGIMGEGAAKSARKSQSLYIPLQQIKSVVKLQQRALPQLLDSPKPYDFSAVRFHTRTHASS
ncbi:hypothetical protein Bbelb_402230 [Branchiostoma belcheri]|nr:hypothetical protein Bbelb_420420 [Branchiostoma belcheri]KAI8482047.1 hypothetical protein Bbelb_402230 [Branchiostoma belcheri]